MTKPDQTRIRIYPKTRAVLDAMLETSGRPEADLIHMALTLFSAASRSTKAIAGAAREIHAARSEQAPPRGALAKTVRRVIRKWRPRNL